MSAQAREGRASLQGVRSELHGLFRLVAEDVVAVSLYLFCT